MFRLYRESAAAHVGDLYFMPIYEDSLGPETRVMFLISRQALKYSLVD